MSEIKLGSAARLFKLEISVATGNKKDKGFTAKVTNDSGAQANVATVRKKIFAHSPELSELEKLRASARNELTSDLVPWEKPYHLIPNMMLTDHIGKASELKNKFDRKVEEFKKSLPNLLDQAKDVLGSLYDPKDYPTVQEIDDYVAKNFRFSYSYPPVTEDAGFIPDIMEEAKDQIRDMMEIEHKQNIDSTVQRLWGNLQNVLNVLSVQLTDNANGKAKSLYDSMITNTLKEVKKMRNYSFVSNSPEMIKQCDDIEKLIKPYILKEKVMDAEGNIKELEKVDISEFRDKSGYGAHYREEMKANVDKVRSEVNNIMDKFGV